jgi:hypothetical protein
MPEFDSWHVVAQESTECHHVDGPGYTSFMFTW